MKLLDYRKAPEKPNNDWRRIVLGTALFNIGCVVGAVSIVAADALFGVRYGVGPGLFLALLALFGISYFGLLAELALAATDGTLPKSDRWTYLWVIVIGIVAIWLALHVLRFVLV